MDVKVKLEPLEEPFEEPQQDSEIQRLKELPETVRAPFPDVEEGDPEKYAIIEQLWMFLKQDVPFEKEKRHDTVAFENERTNIEISKADSRHKIKAKNMIKDTHESELDLLYKYLEVDQEYHEQHLNENKERADTALRGTQLARNTELELDAQIEALTEEGKSFEREIERIEGDLSQYARCKNIVFKMVQMTKNPEIGTNENPLSQNGVIDENDPAFHLPTLEEFLNVLTELKEHNLSLMQNTAKMNNGLEELTRKIQKTSPQVNDKVSLQILDLENSLDTEKTSLVKLKKRVCLHESLKTADEGVMLNALGEKVSKKYIRCVDKRPHLLSTLEMVANMENRLCTLLDQLERIPEDFMEGVLKIKETERSSRQQEELLQHEREKHKEKLKKCMQRSCGDSEKRLGRKLMPRCLPIKSHTKQEKETEVCEENEAFLFPAEDDECIKDEINTFQSQIKQCKKLVS